MSLSFTGIYNHGLRVGYWEYRFLNITFGGCYDDKGFKQKRWIEPAEGFVSLEVPLMESGDYENGIRIGQWKRHGQDNFIPWESPLSFGGFYDDKGMKQGTWTEIYDGVHKKYNTLIIGKYEENIRIGEWETERNNNVLGGGYFNDKGQKDGEWVEVSAYNSKIRFKGDYENGIKIGTWELLHNTEGPSILGNYDMEGRKQGLWTDIIIFDWDCLYYSKGEYKNGIKIGLWTISYNGIEIGGGLYDLSGQKQGQWVEIDTDHAKDPQLQLSGEYQNNKRFGEWSILFKGKIIGSGQYDCDGLMDGEWSYNCEGLYSKMCYKNGQLFNKLLSRNKQIIQCGSYNGQGLKTGSWIYDIDFPEKIVPLHFQGLYENGISSGIWVFKDHKQKIIGGGSYKQGNMEGYWRFLWSKHSSDISWCGELNKNLRVGKWIILFLNQEIGGGEFNELGQQQGRWTEPVADYSYDKQITMEGEYRNGLKFGYWNHYYKRRKIGGGCYDQFGIRIGYWSSADDYSNWNKVIKQEFYQNGVTKEELLILKQNMITQIWDDQ